MSTKTGLQAWMAGVALASLCLLGAGCGGKEAVASGALSSSVVIAELGATRATFDQAWVDANPPDVSWGQGRAWTLGRFFSERWADPGFELRVNGAEGEAVLFTQPGSRRDGREPMIVINQKGVPLVTLAGPDGNPEAFHGRGGARKRSGDESARVIGAVRIELVKGSSPAPAPASDAPTGTLRVMLDGAEQPVLTLEGLRAQPARPLLDEAGNSRGVEFWDLRAWAADRVVVAVVDSEGKALPLDATRWANPSTVPAIRVNRRGAWRFQWVDQDGKQRQDLPSAGNVIELRLRAS